LRTLIQAENANMGAHNTERGNDLACKTKLASAMPTMKTAMTSDSAGMRRCPGESVPESPAPSNIGSES
jgi:hypothetical protein